MRRVILVGFVLLAAGCGPALETDGMVPELNASEVSSEAPIALVDYIAGEMAKDVNKDWGGGRLRSVEARGPVLRVVTQVDDVLPVGRRYNQVEVDAFMAEYFRRSVCSEPSAQVFFGVGATMDLTMLDRDGKRISQFRVSECPAAT